MTEGAERVEMTEGAERVEMTGEREEPAEVGVLGTASRATVGVRRVRGGAAAGASAASTTDDASAASWIDVDKYAARTAEETRLWLCSVCISQSADSARSIETLASTTATSFSLASTMAADSET